MNASSAATIALVEVLSETVTGSKRKMGRELISGLGMTKKERRYRRVEYKVSSGFMLLHFESRLALGFFIKRVPLK